MKMICAVIYTGVQVVHQSVDLGEESEMVVIEIEEMVAVEIAVTGIDHEIIETLIIVGVMM